MGQKSKYTDVFLHSVYQHGMWAADRSGDDKNCRVIVFGPIPKERNTNECLQYILAKV